MTAPKGAAARPLDGGALTRKGNALIGEGDGDGAIILRSTACSSGRHPFSPSSSRLWQKGDEGRNALGFPHPAVEPGFDRAKSALVRRIASDGQESAALLQAVVRAMGRFSQARPTSESGQFGLLAENLLFSREFVFLFSGELFSG
jgi:hypothetical protein